MLFYNRSLRNSISLKLRGRTEEIVLRWKMYRKLFGKVTILVRQFSPSLDVHFIY